MNHEYKRRKAQASIIEYILLTFFLIVIIVFIVFFLSGWYVSQVEIERSKNTMNRALFLTKYFINSPLLTKENSMFDDAKLTSVTCEDLRKVLGENWFLEINISNSDILTECTETNYPDCNHWEFCKKEEKYYSYILPVNIYRNIWDIGTETILGRVDIGIMKAGVYYEK